MKKAVENDFTQEVEALRKSTTIDVKPKDLEDLALTPTGTFKEPVVLGGTDTTRLKGASSNEGAVFSVSIIWERDFEMLDKSSNTYTPQDAVHGEVMTNDQAIEVKLRAVRKAVALALKLKADKTLGFDKGSVLGRRYAVETFVKHS